MTKQKLLFIKIETGIEFNFDIEKVLDEEFDGSSLEMKQSGHCPHCHATYIWWDYFKLEKSGDVKEQKVTVVGRL